MFHLENGMTLGNDDSIDLIVWQDVPAGHSPGIMGVDRGVMLPQVGASVATYERNSPNAHTGGYRTDLSHAALITIDEGTQRRISHPGAGTLVWEYSDGEWTMAAWETPHQAMWDTHFGAWILMSQDAREYLTRGLVPFAEASKQARQTFRLR